jgi:hypothetical protein
VERANEEAAHRRRESQEEIAAMQAEAEARLRALQADTEAVWNERSQVLGDIHAMATRLEEAASAAGSRLSREQASPPPDETPTVQQEAVTEPSDASATPDSARTPP